MIATPAEPSTSPSWKQYLEVLAKALPISLALIFEMTIITVNISNITSPSAKVGLGLSTVIVRSLAGSMINGFNYGFAVFASRTIGSKNFEKYKLYFLQGLINLSILLVVLILFCTFSYKITKFIGQQESMALYTQTFTRSFLPGYICFYVSHFVKMTLQAQQFTKVFVYVDGTCSLFHIIFSNILSHYFQQEQLLIIATNSTFILSLVITLIVERKYSNWKISREFFKVKLEEYWYFVKECAFIAVPLSLDIFIFQFMTLYVGAYKNIPQAAAQVIVTNIFTIIVAVFVGTSSFIGTKIGNLIGLNQPEQIKKVFFMIFKLVIVMVYSLYTLLVIFQDNVISVYTQDSVVAAYIKPVITLLSVFFAADLIQFVMSVYYRSLGYGPYVLKMFLLCSYLIGIPSIVILGMWIENKLLACWLGNMVGLTVLNCLYYLKWKEIDVEKRAGELYRIVKGDGILESLRVKEIQMKEVRTREYNI